MPRVLNIKRYLRRRSLPNNLRVVSHELEHGTVRCVSGFERIFHVNFDAEQNIIVTDFLADMLVKFSPDLTCIGWLGGSGDGRWKTPGMSWYQSPFGQFDWPHSVYIDRNGDLAVAELHTRQITLVDEQGRLKQIIGPDLGKARMNGPMSATFGADGNIYITDYRGHTVYKVNRAGQMLGILGAAPDGEIRDGFVESGRAVASTSPVGFDRPHYADLAEDGFIYVADTNNNCIKRFDQEGHPQGWLGMSADGKPSESWRYDGQPRLSDSPSGFNQPISLEFEDPEHFIVAEHGNGRMQRFTKDGSFRGWIGGRAEGGATLRWSMDGLPRSGSEPGTFSHTYHAKPNGGYLYVADHHNNRLQIVPLNPLGN